jgi:hypothetical protein
MVGVPCTPVLEGILFLSLGDGSVRWRGQGSEERGLCGQIRMQELISYDG